MNAAIQLPCSVRQRAASYIAEMSMRLFVMVTFIVTAASVIGATELRVGTGIGTPGGNALVPVTLSTDTSVIALQFDISASSPGLASDGAVAATALNRIRVASRELSPGLRRVLIFTQDSQPLPNGTLVNLPFSIAANASVGTTTVSPAQVLISNPQFGLVPYTASAGSITISSGSIAEFKSALFDATGVFQLELSATAGRSYRIEASPDLKSWSPLLTEFAVNSLLRVADTNAPRSPARFYRALTLP
jgi:hypothetical protein